MTKVKYFLEQDLVFEEKLKGRFKDLTGKKFGRLTMIGFAGQIKRLSYWYCRCSCGNITKVQAGHLKSGVTKSCGCFNIERVIERSTTHGHAGKGKVSSTYQIWTQMMNRCQNQELKSFLDYGGRGITVCKRWHKFENFLEDMGEKPKGLTIDRIDNERGYYKENCRWATMKEQQNNKRNNHLITFNGKTQNVTQWSEEIGIKRHILYYRINKLNWPIERALSEPVKSLT